MLKLIIWRDMPIMGKKNFKNLDLLGQRIVIKRRRHMENSKTILSLLKKIKKEIIFWNNSLILNPIRVLWNWKTWKTIQKKRELKKQFWLWKKKSLKKENQIYRKKNMAKLKKKFTINMKLIFQKLKMIQPFKKIIEIKISSFLMMKILIKKKNFKIKRLLMTMTWRHYF